MSNYYRINVSINGKYLFATEGGSSCYGITVEKDAKKIVQLFREKFPRSEGYNISVTYWKAHGEQVEF